MESSKSATQAMEEWNIRRDKVIADKGRKRIEQQQSRILEASTRTGTKAQ